MFMQAQEVARIADDKNADPSLGTPGSETRYPPGQGMQSGSVTHAHLISEKAQNVSL